MPAPCAWPMRGRLHTVGTISSAYIHHSHDAVYHPPSSLAPSDCSLNEGAGELRPAIKCIVESSQSPYGLTSKIRKR